MYAGNAVIVNFFMRWPILFPTAVVVCSPLFIEPTPVQPKVEPVVQQIVVPEAAPKQDLQLTTEIKKVEPQPLPPKKKING